MWNNIYRKRTYTLYNIWNSSKMSHLNFYPLSHLATLLFNGESTDQIWTFFIFKTHKYFASHPPCLRLLSFNFVIHIQTFIFSKHFSYAILLKTLTAAVQVSFQLSWRQNFVFFTRGQIAERVKNIWDFVCLFVLLSPPLPPTFPPLSFEVKWCLLSN